MPPQQFISKDGGIAEMGAEIQVDYLSIIHLDIFIYLLSIYNLPRYLYLSNSIVKDGGIAEMEAEIQVVLLLIVILLVVFHQINSFFFIDNVKEILY